MIFTPTRRYSAVAVFSEDLKRVVLIHKLRPAWQAGKANFPGGKVDTKDWPPPPKQEGDFYMEAVQEAYLACAVRELQEETGLVVDAASLTLFCTLRFLVKALPKAQGEQNEVQFFCCVGDVEAARTMESETVFDDDVASVLQGKVCYTYPVEYAVLSTLPNLPWLTAMARQTLRGDGAGWPFVVYEAGATP